MQFRRELGRFCGLDLVFGCVFVILATAMLAFTSHMNQQQSSGTTGWAEFYYKWVNPGFSIPAREWQTPTEYLWPSLTLLEARAAVGQRVRCAYRSDTVTGGCNVGDRGIVKDIARVPDGGFFVVVQWETAPGSELCYYGRYSRRLFLTPE